MKKLKGHLKQKKKKIYFRIYQLLQTETASLKLHILKVFLCVCLVHWDKTAPLLKWEMWTDGVFVFILLSD